MSIEILTEQEREKINNWANKTTTAYRIYEKDIRNATMIMLMLDAGLRVGEVSQLTKSCLFFGSEVSKVVTIPGTISKNKTARDVPITIRLDLLIRKMQDICWYPDQCPADGRAFYSNWWTTGITSRQIERIVNSISQSIIGRRIHPHVLRHTFATRLMRITKLSVVQELLGHKSLSSTSIYLHPSSVDTTTAIEKLN